MFEQQTTCLSAALEGLSSKSMKQIGHQALILLLRLLESEYVPESELSRTLSALKGVCTGCTDDSILLKVLQITLVCNYLFRDVTRACFASLFLNSHSGILTLS